MTQLKYFEEYIQAAGWASTTQLTLLIDFTHVPPHVIKPDLRGGVGGEGGTRVVINTHSYASGWSIVTRLTLLSCRQQGTPLVLTPVTVLICPYQRLL